MLRRLAIVLAALGLLAGIWALLPNWLFYRERRPTRFGRVTNRAMGWWAAHGGPPSSMVTLETQGRRSGRTLTNVLVVARHDGQDYLVSMLGERSAWVRNARAAGGGATIRHGRPRRVRFVEVPVEERAPILKAYLRRAIGGRPHFTLSPDASVAEFASVAAGYPVFRIVDAIASPAAGRGHELTAGLRRIPPLDELD